ncbi:cupin domain-containing protein [Fusibacter ferrireducens]|uniref:Cupin domain-containing protein n=1 Tax=Fusibacter ferrireducens TaxID=2785058 RepID=A0ABR9ZXL0_9FIRM|nr:cupin domain-containing protein [Fusibacter ferrireducens]MBF4695201.1 cupin domain-containing protein [Fusibacter ferrireducens]
MIVGNFNDLTASKIMSDAAKNAAMKVLVSPTEGWEDHVMRVVELEAEGFSPKHQHDWPHINYVIEGEGTLLIEDTLHPLKAGSYAFVPPNTLHQFSNTGSTPLKFICIVPVRGHQ